MSGLYDLPAFNPNRRTAEDENPQPPSPRPLNGDLHPYAKAAVTAELARLDALPRPWHKNAYWDQTTFDVACNLIEIANSPWSGYTIIQADLDLHGAAPQDSAWGTHQVEKCWKSAIDRIGGSGRPMPTENTPIPEPVILTPAEPEPSDLSAYIRDKFKLLDWHELWEQEDEEEEWIVEPIIPARRLIALFSAPKIGKSLLMLELAVAISRGTSVLGYIPDRPRRVLYVDFENDPRGDIRQRLRAMHLTPEHLTDLCYLSYPTLAKLDNAQGAAELMAVIAEYECEVVIIDTISRAVGGEENENDTWLSFYRHTGLAMKQNRITCVRLDHTGKDHDKGMRGGSAKYGDVDAVWKLSRIMPDSEIFELECSDHRMHFTETKIVLTREHLPKLWHRVHAEGQQAAWDAKVTAVLEQLDSSGLPNDTAIRPAADWLRAHGHSARQVTVAQAVSIRKSRLDEPPPGTDWTEGRNA